MQTILGAGGAIGSVLAKELKRYTEQVRLVGRTPKKVNANDELFPADLLAADAVDKAVEGSEIVYLTAGLEYKTKIWQQSWPVIMDNVITACKHHHSKMVFFDNAYAYDPSHLSNLTEETPQRPISKKGKVRDEISKRLLQETGLNKLEGMIVRASDFYGPGVNTSFMMETVYKRMRVNKKPMWIGNANSIHSMTYTPDAAKATALLGNTPDAFQQIWHLPTSEERLSGKEWISLFADAMNRPASYTRITAGLIKTFGLFNGFFKELGEMMYQFESDYFFNSNKFHQRFPDFAITSGREGIAEIIKADE